MESNQYPPIDMELAERRFKAIKASLGLPEETNEPIRLRRPKHTSESSGDEET